SGDGQSHARLTRFPIPIVVRVTDANGDPVPLANVQMIPPSSGPSATLSTLERSDANGEVRVTATANDEPGTFTMPIFVYEAQSAATTVTLTNVTPTYSTVCDDTVAAIGTATKAAAALSARLCRTLTSASLAEQNGNLVKKAAKIKSFTTALRHVLSRRKPLIGLVEAIDLTTETTYL